MSATNKQTADFATEAGAVCQARFRVRCDRLSHGEEVFLVTEGDAAMQKALPLYTTASSHPWYQTLQPLTLSLPPAGKSDEDDAAAADGRSTLFRYRYAVHRAGVFYRWERRGDSDDVASSPSSAGNDAADDGMDVSSCDMKKAQSTTSGGGDDDCWHSVQLRRMRNHESYVVSDALGAFDAAGDPDRIATVLRRRDPPADTAAATLHSRTSSSKSLSSTASPGSTKRKAAAAVTASTAVPPPAVPPYGGGAAAAANPPAAAGTAASPHKQSIHLTSTDGLVVVSAFLPIILHRSDATGRWTADWDYEMLLSMQTHLRVTRVGVVKWRGWHGNTGGGGSPEAGVPRQERHLVEECLRPFHCVPVWVDPALFGKMYNGFCKGVLWPVFHNVASVYSSSPEDNDIFPGRQQATADVLQQLAEYDPGSVAASDRERDEHHERLEQLFAEYSMDDVEQGPIHGGRGREAELWSAYNTVNRQFADTVVQCFNEGDLVWVHGFHLLILPSYLTRRISMAKVGIFLHTPFPSSEIFRTLWCREDLLRGMLNADQVGFHLFEYARHFLTSCRRLLGLDYGMIPDTAGGHTLAVDTAGRHVAVTSIHAGVEPPVLHQVLRHVSTVETAQSIRGRFPGKHICCGIDRLESLKGIPLKLLGLERFLRRCPAWVGRVVLVQVGISAFERREDYERTKREVHALVQKINGTWPGTVQFQECTESEMRLQQRMALLRAADTCVVTSIRDGLNLLPLEFTIAHQDAMAPGQAGRAAAAAASAAQSPAGPGGRHRGLVVLSEFSSCTRVMRGALHVNPWKISEIARAFHTALHMTDDERMRRIRIASEFVTRVTTQRWALAVMLDLKGVHKNVSPVQYSGAGLGLGYRLLGMDKSFVSLDASVVAKAYKNSRARLILLDYGGTIVSNDNLDNLMRFQMVKERSSPTVPTDRMIATLTALCQDQRNTVFVVSGKERHSLTKTLGHIPNLGLAAEHGMFLSWPSSSPPSSSNNRNTWPSSSSSGAGAGAGGARGGSGGNKAHKRRWETLVPETDRTWRTLAVNLMEVYTSRTHGSYIEETEMKVLWQYRDADTEFGFLQAKELEDHLAKYLRSFPVDILHGGIEEGGYVEVRPKGVNKGVLAMRVIRHFPAMARGQDRVDFALVLGDDHCDEPMLSVMRQIGRRIEAARRAATGQDPLPDMPATIQLVDVSSCDSYVSPRLETFTCTVPKKPSAAANYLHDVEEVQELLDGLVKVSTRDRRFYSSADLRSSGDQLSAFDAAGVVESAAAGGFPGAVDFGQGGLASPPSVDMALPSAGMMIKSMSLDQMKLQQQQQQQQSRGSRPTEEVSTSKSLNDYLGHCLGPIEDGEDDEAGFFF